MRVAHLGIFLATGGCLLGVPVSIPPPAVVGEPVVVSPLGVGDALPAVRAGVEVEVALAISTTTELDNSTISLGGLTLSCTGSGSAVRCTGTPTGSEVQGRVRLAAELQGYGGPTATGSRELAVFDFTPPTAGCVITPSDASALSKPTLTVVTSEAILGGAPDAMADDPRFDVTYEAEDEGRYIYRITGPSGVDVDAYVLRVSGMDLAGNPQEGDSLCDAQERTARWSGRGPALASEPTLSVTPSVLVDGERVARAEAALRLTLPTERPIDPTASFVSLSGVVLSHVGDDVWEGTLRQEDGDGRKAVAATLVDMAGNPLTVSRPDVGFVADLTPPDVATASIVRSPTFAAADEGTGVIQLAAVDGLTGLPVTATLSLVATEPLKAAGALLSDPLGLTAGAPEVADRRASWLLDELPDDAGGRYDLEVRLTDLVGNESPARRLPLALEVDTSPPAPPDTDTVDRIVLTRAPNGDWDAPATPRFEVVGGDGAVEPLATVVLESRGGAVADSGRATSSGAFGPLRLTTELTEVFVRQLDAAGNLSERARVRDTRWTLRATPDAATSRAISLETATRMARSREPFDGTQAAAAPPVRTVSLPSWTPWKRGRSSSVTSAGQPDSLVYDPIRGVLLEPRPDGNRTWDGLAWHTAPMSAGTYPPATDLLAYDDARGLVLAVGGDRGACGPGQPTGCLETWTFDGTTWTERHPPVAPPTRQSSAMAYDAHSAVTILFGGLGEGANACGNSASRTCSDTWAWDGSHWSSVPADVRPEPRSGHAMAYDDDAGVIWLTGGVVLPPTRCGSADPTNRCDDLWAWDGAAWTSVPQPVRAPARTEHQLVVDPVAGLLLAFGGDTEASNYDVDDLWAWDGSAWSELAVPDPRRGVTGVLVWDDARQQRVIVPNTTAATLWVQDQGDWQGIPTTETPAPRRGAAAVWDPWRGVVVLFGGLPGGRDDCEPDDRRPCIQTWHWNGDGWYPRVSDPEPHPRADAAMAFDEIAKKTVLFGGETLHNETCGTSADWICEDTWEWDGSSWIERTPLSGPPGRLEHAMAWSENDASVLLTGGERHFGDCGSTTTPACEDTWTWNGTSWAEQLTAERPLRRRAAAAASAPGGGVLLVGGHATFSFQQFFLRDSWSWDGDWRPVDADTGMGPRASHAIAYAPDTQTTWLFGGRTGEAWDTARDDTWTLEGDTWTTRAFETAPSARSGHILVHDEVRGELVLFGGAGTDAYPLGDTWTYDGLDAERAPGHASTVSLSASDVDDATVRAVTVWWSAGGVGVPGGIEAPGAQLQVWDRAAWRVVDSHEAGPDAPETLCWSVRVDDAPPAPAGCIDTVDPALVARLFQFGPDHTARWSVRPIADAGWGDGVVQTDGVVVEVRYRTP